jgi:hypothetical protein
MAGLAALAVGFLVVLPIVVGSRYSECDREECGTVGELVASWVPLGVGATLVLLVCLVAAWKIARR